MVEVILVEDSISESAIACIAIALRRPGTRVGEARNLREAGNMVDGAAGTPLVILGARSLSEPLEAFMRLVGARAAVVGLANRIADATRERALRAGVRAVYERPLDWKDYAATVKSVLEHWIGSPELERG
jgi:hypothetical protein